MIEESWSQPEVPLYTNVNSGEQDSIGAVVQF